MIMTTLGAASAGAAAGGSGSLLGTLGLATIPAAVGGIINGIFGHKANKDNKEQAEKLNAQNLAFQREQFEYQKYLNQNQFQMMAQDAAKAGINPLAMQGGNVSSTSFSGSSAQGTQNPINVGDLGSFLSPVLNYKLGQQQQRIEERKTNLELKLGYEQLHEQRRNNNMIDKLQRDLSDSASRDKARDRLKDLVMFGFNHALQKDIFAESKRKNSADIQFNKDSLAEIIRNNNLNYELGLGSQAISSYLLPYQANLLSQQTGQAYESAYSSWINNVIAANSFLPVGAVPDNGLLDNLFGNAVSRALMGITGKLKFPVKVNPFNVSDSDRNEIQAAFKRYIEERKKNKDKK